MDVCVVGPLDGLIDPSRVPGAELDPERVAAAADALDGVAAGVAAAADEVDVSWSAMPASFVAPDAYLVYSGMRPATDKARGMARRFTRVAAALRVYSEELGAARKALMRVKADAEEWLAEEFDDENRVWVLAHRTRQYELDVQVSGLNVVTDPFEYLRSRGEAVRSGWLGYPEIRAYWLESGDHVDRNNELVDRVSDAYAKLNAIQVECANEINRQRDVSGEELTAIDAGVLKGEGEYAISFPWGQKSDGDRTCTENFGQGMKNTGVEFLAFTGNLAGVDYNGGDWSWTWGTAGETWAGLGIGVGSLLVASNWITASLGVAGVPVLSDAMKNTGEMLKGLVSWEKWATNPAEAAGEVVAGFIPLGGWAAKGAKAAARVIAARAAIARSATAAATAAARLGSYWDEALEGSAKLLPGGVDTTFLDTAANGTGKPKAGDTSAETRTDTDTDAPDRQNHNTGDGQHDHNTDNEQNPHTDTDRPNDNGDAQGNGNNRDNDSDSGDGDGGSGGGQSEGGAIDASGRVPGDALQPDPTHPGRVPSEPPNVGDPDGGPGRWEALARDVGDRWSRYQEQISGVLSTKGNKILEYIVHTPNGEKVEFDGHVWRGDPPVEVYLEAKRGYGIISTGPEFITDGQLGRFLEQAERQTKAIRDHGGTGRLEWHFSDQRAADVVREFFDREGVKAFVYYTPEV